MAPPPTTAVTIAFARRLKACRQAAGYETAKEAAEALEIDQHRYRLYEAGKREPGFDVLIRIADLVGKSIDFLIRGASPTPPTK